MARAGEQDDRLAFDDGPRSGPTVASLASRSRMPASVQIPTLLQRLGAESAMKRM